jgi:hypothetical protein
MENIGIYVPRVEAVFTRSEIMSRYEVKRGT